jgi:peptidoglycan/xylan/chitin deacetylase (PgdA/CDA1 family)
MTTSQRIVQRVKWGVAHILIAIGFVGWLRRRRASRREIAVLWLHRVAGTPRSRVPMGIPPEVFESLLVGLSRHYDLLNWNGCSRVHAEGSSRPGIYVTFDDGYADNARTAWPALTRVGGGGAFFLATDFVSGRRTLWWEWVAGRCHAGGERYPVKGNGQATYGTEAEREIARIKSLPTDQRDRTLATMDWAADPSIPALDWREARDMTVAGADLGGHTVSHPILPNCTDERLDTEIADSRAEIARETGVTPALFAYPNGSYDDRVASAVERAGYTHAFTIEKGVFSPVTDRYRIPRIGVSEPKYSLDGANFSWPMFECEMLGVFDVLLMRRRRRESAY